MKITRKQLRKLINEAIALLSENSDEYISVNNHPDVQKSLSDIVKRISNIEDAIEIMGGAIISLEPQHDNIQVDYGDRDSASVEPIDEMYK